MYIIKFLVATSELTIAHALKYSHVTVVLTNRIAPHVGSADTL